MRLRSFFSTLVCMAVVGCGVSNTELGETAAAVDGGKCSKVGQEASAGDGCNSCTCLPSGVWTCSDDDCDPVQCPAVNAPTADFCDDGSTAQLVEKENGCSDWACVAVQCPAVGPPTADFCEAGSKAKLVKGDDGCENWACVAVQCPAVNAPPAGFCEDGSTAKLVKKENGCEDWACVASQ